ncbi:damage-control phosphatase ARMT1-like isoform X2 [Cylas formicarius]|uniref:damage-control phosphatase ARMT1-like isoform X2 n=1 Tax=Cylas formicarius TaxID=197179 RepID=UPI0029589AD4|nr:damage-control phosphatase ARMT1-like isoform X2 [Cylas formicarius]
MSRRPGMFIYQVFTKVKNRMPVILTQLIDGLARRKVEISIEFGDRSAEELKMVIGELSKLKYEIQTNKPLRNLTSDAPDIQLYNEYIAKQATEEGHATYFNTIWLLTECYMYRKIKEVFELTSSLRDFDYFQSSKIEAYEKSLPLMTQMGQYLVDMLQDNSISSRDVFLSLLELNLWGNKCDLSISLGKVAEHAKLFDTASLEKFVLVNDSDKIWEAISDKNATSDIVDIVLDNSGYEVFTDLCLADYLISTKLAGKIRIYVKTIPWFISDVTMSDFNYTINQLKLSDISQLKELGHKWEGYVKNGTWSVIENSFWTSPFEFKYMESISPDLYKQLAQAKVIFFKGDLNYRKLFGEINWDPSAPVELALQGFHPSKLCILRTIKADIVVGLKEGVAESIEAKNPEWMWHGDYGLIQFCNKVVQIN